MRQANVYMYDRFTGILVEDEEGYTFSYDSAYLRGNNPEPISLTLPLSSQPFHNRVLFPFFDGLIPEGWLLEIAEKNWKLNTRDRMGLLLACCKDCIGAVSIQEQK
jgi:serine/threonine-protein kinase HipA